MFPSHQASGSKRFLILASLLWRGDASDCMVKLCGTGTTKGAGVSTEDGHRPYVGKRQVTVRTRGGDVVQREMW